MKPSTILSLILLLLAFISCSQASSPSNNFLQCLSKKSISNIIYTPTNSSYSSILQITLQNPRFNTNSTSKPFAIITPEHESQIPPIILCAKRSGVETRTRSGGHDFDGLSYQSQVPFVIIDLINFNEVTVDVEHKTAWVGVGTTLGAFYYAIAQKSPVLSFPAGICPTVGIGGHITGGGYGVMMRKYGIAADHVVDARIVDVNGRILDKKSMGEDLFWAIRGGGAASYGVITAWKVELVDVPETVTVFRVSRTLEQNATQIIHRWQYVAPHLDKDLFIGITLTTVNSTESTNKLTINANFFSLFFGQIDKLLPLMKEKFPELGLVREDCTEVSWIKAAVFISGLPVETPTEVLLNRTYANTRRPFKGKSDYVQQPIPESGLEGLWRHFFEPEGRFAAFAMNPYGGRMAEISESAIPFPHRTRNLFKILQVNFWREDENRDSEKFIKWSRRVNRYLAPYVSRNPRAAYFNYRDLDLGVNNVEGKTSYEQASVWGKRYYKDNFDRLVQIKSVVDPDNFFRNEQSIPTLH